MKSDIDWKTKESQKIIKLALKKWPSCAIAFTGGKDSTVLLDLVRRVTDKTPPLLFIDHKLHFDETYEFVRKLQRDWGLNILFEFEPKVFEKLKKEKKLNKKRILSRVFKIETINYSIKKYRWKALFVGIRWDEHPARSTEKYFSKRETHWRVHPILHFTEKDIWQYIRKNKLPYNPLYDRGYRSLDEKLFTKPVSDPDAPERSGREKEKEKIMERLRVLGYF